ncbi:hypothetical protein HZS_1532 [Henneguya salminicola]|nr:hypothetical protein HZS_1532 [Henneguya salminicola]
MIKSGIEIIEISPQKYTEQFINENSSKLKIDIHIKYIKISLLIECTIQHDVVVLLEYNWVRKMITKLTKF